VHGQPQLGDHLEAGVEQHPGQLLGAVEVGRPGHREAAVPLGPLDVAVADVLADQRLATGNERRGERPQHAGQRRAREVEQRPPAEHTAERSGREVELGRRGDGEPQVGVLPAGVRDHPRREVDARGVQAEPGEVRGDGARAAADVEDRPEPAHGLGERAEHGPQPGLLLQPTHRELHVGVGDAVVGLANRLEVGGLRHGRHPTQAARERRSRRA
jgi:hypothetical protein